MKTKLSFFMFCFILSSINATAQIKLNSDGNVIVGTETSATATDSVSSLKIYPTNNGRLAAISFGDGSDAYIGKVADKNIVKIYGNDGFNLSTLNHANVMTYSDSTNLVSFGGDVTVMGVFTELGFQQDDTPGAGVGDSVIQGPLTPVLPLATDMTALETIEEITVSTLDATASSTAVVSAGEYGIDINMMRQMFPDLVIIRPNGKVYVDYMRMIPLLISAISELKAQLDSPVTSEPVLSPMNENLETASVNTFGEGEIIPKLYQNSPNPFSSVTTIKYALPENVNNAMLYVYDLQGSQKLSVEITERGENSVDITASKLPAGMYIYALVADGKEIDTKRMILTR